MNKILLSINPEYVEKIFSGEKEYEFRKIKAKYNPDKIIIYCTAPISAVVGEADVVDIIHERPDKLWEKTKIKAGVDEKFFFEYYKNKEKAIAYKLKNIVKYTKERELNDYGVKMAPQSFIYL